MKLVNNLDFSKYEARNMRLQNLAAAPSSPSEGQEYYDTTLKTARVWNGTAWVNSGGTAGAVTAVTGAAPITSTGGTTPEIGITDATTAARGAMSAADKTKLNGIATGATANATDAQLRDRATHTGAQAISTVTGLQTALDAKLDDSQRGAANGVASLGADGKVPSSELPALAFTNVTVVASIAARDALTGMAEGDVAKVTGGRSYIWDGTTWVELDSLDGVQSVGAGTGITIGGTSANPTVSITNGGVGATQLSTAVAGNGLTGGGGAALAVGAGTGISVAADSVAIDTAVVVRKAAFNVGDASATSFVLAHNLGTRDVTTVVYSNAAPYDEVLADVEHTDTNNVTVRFAAAPTASQYRVVVHG
jgi:hypothetical protein